MILTRLPLPRAILVLGLLILLGWSPESNIQAQDGGTVSSPEEDLFAAEGVESNLLARSDASIEPADDLHLTLARVTVPSGAVLPEWVPASPELIYVERGLLSFEDAFGFTVSPEAGESLALEGGLTYQFVNPGNETTILYWLTLQEVVNQAQPSSSPSAEFASPVSSRQSSEPKVEVLISESIAEKLPEPPHTLYIIHAQLAPQSSTGEQFHSGALGIYVENGTLNVLSPSGAEGQLSEKNDAILPPDFPLLASNATSEDVQIFLAGVSRTGAPLLSNGTADVTFNVGVRVIVTEEGLRMRAEPTLEAIIVTELSADEVLTIDSGPQSNQGYVWWQATADSGDAGWIPEDFLEAIP